MTTRTDCINREGALKMNAANGEGKEKEKKK